MTFWICVTLQHPRVFQRTPHTSRFSDYAQAQLKADWATIYTCCSVDVYTLQYNRSMLGGNFRAVQSGSDN